jgi:hypothetical protein
MKLSKQLKLFALTMLTVFFFNESTFCQSVTDENAGDEYVFIMVTGKIFSKKLNVEVDFGDSPEQVKKSEEYSQALDGKKSWVAVLNYMLTKGYEMVELCELVSTYSGTGGTTGLGYFMRRIK